MNKSNGLMEFDVWVKKTQGSKDAPAEVTAGNSFIALADDEGEPPFTRLLDAF